MHLLGQSQNLRKIVKKQQVGESQQLRYTNRGVSRFTAHNLNIFAKKSCFQHFWSQHLWNPTLFVGVIFHKYLALFHKYLAIPQISGGVGSQR
jgi:hypothetical protein